MKTLPATRTELQKEIRACVKKFGPSLGSVYYDQSDKWEKTLSTGGSSGGTSTSSSGKGNGKIDSSSSTSSSTSSTTTVEHDAEQGNYSFSTGMSATLPPPEGNEEEENDTIATDREEMIAEMRRDDQDRQFEKDVGLNRSTDDDVDDDEDVDEVTKKEN